MRAGFRTFTFALIGLALLLPVLTAWAQPDGQFCVRAFEDRNGNGVRDGGEPLLRDGVSAELSDENGVIIGSALMINSPTAEQGLICFTGLAPAQYTISVNSADYEATTPETLTITLQEGDLPAVLDYGARAFSSTDAVEVPLVAAPSTGDSLMRVLWSVLAATVAALVMLLLGLLIWFLFFRRSAPPEIMEAPSDTAKYRRPPTDTDRFPPAS